MNKNIYGNITGTGITTNVVTLTGSSGSSVEFTLANIMALRGKIEQQRGRPDTMVTIPYAAAIGSGSEMGWYPFVQANMTSVQYTAALADYLRTGSIGEFFGLRLFIDKQYDQAITNYGSNANDSLISVLVSNEALGWAQAEDIVSEVQRWARQVGFYIVTHSIGQSATVMEPFVAAAKHQ
jgi:hypothetical protein